MVDVLLVHAPDISGDPRKGPPLALAYLSAQLKVKGWTTHLVDLNLFPDWRRLLTAWLHVITPRLVAISATAFSIQSVTDAVALCKRWDPVVPVIAGGYCSLAPNLREIAGLDAFCVGEGDWVLCEIMDQIASGCLDFASIKSLAFHDSNGHWHENQCRPLLTAAELDALPFPDFSDIEPPCYGEVPALPLYVQRGCYNACRFCDIATFYHEQRVRAMTPARVAEWIQKAKQEFRITHIQFMDDDFLSRPSWFATLAAKIQVVPRDYALLINFQTRPGDVLRAQKELTLHASSLYQLELGVESFSQSQLDRWDKHQTPLDATQAISFLSELRVPTLVYLIFSDRGTTIFELRENVAGLLACPPICSFPNRSLVPAVVACHDINTIYSLTGEREIGGIPFLEAFDGVLEATENAAGRAYYFYLALQSAVEQAPPASVTREIGSPLLKLIEKIFASRLTKALECADQVHNAENVDWRPLVAKLVREIEGDFDAVSHDLARMPKELRA
jgi:hypothetical protein